MSRCSAPLLDDLLSSHDRSALGRLAAGLLRSIQPVLLASRVDGLHAAVRPPA
jgi:hypothetical protein